MIVDWFKAQNFDGSLSNTSAAQMRLDIGTLAKHIRDALLSFSDTLDGTKKVLYHSNGDISNLGTKLQARSSSHNHRREGS